MCGLDRVPGGVLNIAETAMWDYSEKVKDHFLNPRNVGVVDSPDGVGDVGNIQCGDALKLTFKLDDEERLADVKFQTFGCASAIASSSALTEMIKGKPLAEAAEVTDDDIAEYLGGLPEEKMHCSVMGREALEKAIAYYRSGGGDAAVQEGEIVCTCFGVTDKTIERTIKDHGLTTVEQVTHFCKAGGGCGSCTEQIEEMLERFGPGKPEGEKSEPPPGEARPLTNIQRMRLVEQVLGTEIRPSLQHDGGDVELVDVDGKTIRVSLLGTCKGCAASGVTLKALIEQKLREYVESDIVVEEVEE